MCGIFGFNSQEIDENIFFDLMSHRGPDAQGVKRHGDWTLGHLRLSIIDIQDKSNQPFTKDGAFLVFNGEIYNYKELKSEHFKHEEFLTDSDTELLISMLNKFGMQALNSLNGMFAFAYLSGEGELFLIRDRYGVKQLYYCQIGNIFLFSSEIKPLLCVKGEDELDLDIIESFRKGLGTDFDSRSGYVGVNGIEKGTYLKIDKSKNISKTKWYFGSDSHFIIKRTHSLTQICEDILIDAVKLRCRSDVPVAITLSGGIDSTTLYTLIKEHVDVPVQPFIFKHRTASTDESNLAINLAKKYGDNPILVQQEGDYLTDLKSAMYYLEMPIWNPSAIAYYSMYREIARRGYKVVIEGHGSDELLGGYPYMINAALIEVFKKVDFFYALEILNVLNQTVHKGLGEKWMFLNKLRIFLSVIRQVRMKKPSFDEVVSEGFETKLLPMILRAFDRLTMAHSLESRMPFLDYRFVEFGKDLPLNLKINKLGNKSILREILKKYGHEEIYLNKEKMGFASDLPEVFKDVAIKNFFSELCQELTEESREYFLEKIKAGIAWKDINDIWKETSIHYYKTRHPLMLGC